MDNKELVAGTTLFLPVFVAGANFSAGDGHACQGDGEVNSNGLETALSGTFTLIVHKGKTITMPRAETDAHYITMGMDLDLDDAATQALREMIAFIGGAVQHRARGRLHAVQPGRGPARHPDRRRQQGGSMRCCPSGRFAPDARRT